MTQRKRLQCEVPSYGQAFCPRCGGLGSAEVGEDAGGAFGRGECPECHGCGHVDASTVMIVKKVKLFDACVGCGANIPIFWCERAFYCVLDGLKIPFGEKPVCSKRFEEEPGISPGMQLIKWKTMAAARMKNEESRTVSPTRQ